MKYTMALSIKCLACGFEFKSKYQRDEEMFKTAVESKSETSPKSQVRS